MDHEEMKAKLKDVITARVKDDIDAAKDAFHQVLQAKMRQRISPADDTAADPTVETTDDQTSTDDDQLTTTSDE